MKKYEDNRKCNVRKTLRLTDAQWQMIQERMSRVGLTDFNRYARQMLIDGYFFVIDDRKELKEMTYEINKIGTNINQITYKLNSTGIIKEEEIDELKLFMKSIWNMQRNILSADDNIDKYVKTNK